MRPITLTNPTAFDAFASDYDSTFTASRLGQMLRPRVWTQLAAHFSAGQHVLELTCGTGEDAVWLAQQGVQVMATDGSAEMVAATTEKAKQAGVKAQVAARQLSLQQLIAGALEAEPFDGVYSNFGGLNTINNWAALAEALAPLVKPGGTLVLVPMGPFCPWEIGWYLAHGQLRNAFRRFRGPASAKIGADVIPIWYPSAKQLREDFSPWFVHRHTESLELWLPPSYLGHLVDRWPRLFDWLHRLEQASAGLTKGWGDHYICVLERVN